MTKQQIADELHGLEAKITELFLNARKEGLSVDITDPYYIEIKDDAGNVFHEEVYPFRFIITETVAL